MLESVMLAEARVDPSRAAFRISSEVTKENPASVEMLGSKLASSLRGAAEHQAFLAAMRQVEAKSGRSPVLAKVRSQYVANLSSEMIGWPFEDASALISAEFSPGEIVTASLLISTQGLADVDRWADWFSKVEAPRDGKDPLSNFMHSWSQTDPGAAAAFARKHGIGE
jgi:hypothetical protein